MRSRFGLDTVAAAAAAFLALALFPLPAAADHSLGQSCYVCHKLSSAAVYRGTRAINTSLSVGLPSPVTQPLNCEFCHLNYRDQFNALAKSAHPVRLIEGQTTMFVNGNGTYQAVGSYVGVQLYCADCHSGDTVLTGPASPDVAPYSYDQAGKDNTFDGYPNHDLDAAANNLVLPFVPLWDATPAAGDEPHLGIPNAAINYVYRHAASTNPAADYSLCLYCHDGSAKTTRQVNVQAAYTAAGGGHTFKSDGARIACLDCHDSHGSTSVKLYNRAASPIAADANHRLVCLDCHGQTRPFTDVTGTLPNRSVAVPAAPAGVAAHTGGTSACTLCHDPHNPLAVVANCYHCHSTNTTAEIKTALGAGFTKYVDNQADDDFAYTGTSSKHDITFADNNNAHCLDCHEITIANHANGNAADDLKYNGPTGANWPVSTVNETGTTFGSGVEFCLGCHRGGTNYWGLTPPTIGGFKDFGPDNLGNTADDVTNSYGEGDTAVTGYSSHAPLIYDTLTGAGHDPPSGYTGVPLFAHYTQGGTSGGALWRQLGNTTAPQPLPCMDCHYAHGAPNAALYRSPTGTTGLGSEKGGSARSICMNCHSGTATLEGRTPADPTDPRLNDRFNNPVPAHDPASGQSCSSSSPLNPTGCHNAHTPSCEVCHGYPP